MSGHYLKKFTPDVNRSMIFFNGAINKPLLHQIEELRRKVVVDEQGLPFRDEHLERELDVHSWHIACLYGDKLVSAVRINSISNDPFPFIKTECAELLDSRLLHVSMLVIDYDYRGGRLFYHMTRKIAQECLGMDKVGALYQVSRDTLNTYLKLGAETITSFYAHPDLPIEVTGMLTFFAADRNNSDPALFRLAPPVNDREHAIDEARTILDMSLNNLRKGDNA